MIVDHVSEPNHPLSTKACTLSWLTSDPHLSLRCCLLEGRCAIKQSQSSTVSATPRNLLDARI